MIMIHPVNPMLMLVAEGRIHLVGMSSDEMRSLADELRNRADEVDAAAAEAALAVLARAGGRA